MSIRHLQAFAAGFVAFGLLVSLGCGPAEPFTHAQISGKVTYEDGTPIKAQRVRIIFHPQTPPVDQKTHPRSGETDLGADGSFSNVTSHKFGDGVVVGEHKVTLIALDDQDREIDVFDSKYKRLDETPLMINTEDYSADTPIEIKIPKPPSVR